MAGPLIPLIIGAGARILGGQAARAAASQGVRAAAGQGARASASQGGKAATRTAGRRTATTPKWASSGKKPRLSPGAKKNRAQTARVRSKAPNAGKGSKNKATYGTAGELRQEAMRQQLRQSASVRRGQAIRQAKAAKRTKRVKSLRAQAGITGGSAVAYEAGRLAVGRKPAPPKTSTPMRVKRKNAPVGYEVNYDPNRKKR